MKVGHCIDCDEKIMVQGTDGRWSSRKYNFREAELVYANKSKIRITICEDCMAGADLQKIIDALTGKDSVCNAKTIDFIKSNGLPVSIQLANTPQGKRLGE